MFNTITDATFARSTRRLATAAVLAAAGLAPATLRAQSTPAPMASAAPASGAAVEQQLTKASAPTAGLAESATDQLDAMQRRFRAAQSPPLFIGATRNPGNAYVGFADAAVTVKAGDVAWGQARFDAYERALAKAEAEFVQFQGVTITSRTVSDTFANMAGTPVPPEPTSSQLGQCEEDIKDRVVKLALSLSEADLKSQLKKFGVDPATVAGQSQQANADRYRDLLWKQSTSEAAAQLAGMRTLQTFEAVGDDGAWHVGVLVVETANMADLARTIAQGRAAQRGMLEPGAPIDQQIDASDQQLLMDFGVRTLVDENGDRCIVAFGQAPVDPASKTADPIVAGQMSDAAVETAKDLCKAEVAEFANSAVDYSSKLTQGDDLKVDQNLQRQTNVFAARNAHFRRDSSVKITGLTQLRKYHAKHPTTGQEFVGVVMMWSPTSEYQALTVGRPVVPPPAVTPMNTGPAANQGQNYDKRTKDW